jgi:hypothetical protein
LQWPQQKLLSTFKQLRKEFLPEEKQIIKRIHDHLSPQREIRKKKKIIQKLLCGDYTKK